MVTKKRKTEQIPVPVYFNPTTFSEIAKDAVKAGKRGVMIQDKKMVEHGFPGEYTWTIKGIGKFLKSTWLYWKRSEAERLAEQARLVQEERALAERKKKAGMI